MVDIIKIENKTERIKKVLKEFLGNKHSLIFTEELNIKLHYKIWQDINYLAELMPGNFYNGFYKSICTCEKFDPESLNLIFYFYNINFSFFSTNECSYIYFLRDDKSGIENMRNYKIRVADYMKLIDFITDNFRRVGTVEYARENIIKVIELMFSSTNALGIVFDYQTDCKFSEQVYEDIEVLAKDIGQDFLDLDIHEYITDKKFTALWALNVIFNNYDIPYSIFKSERGTWYLTYGTSGIEQMKDFTAPIYWKIRKYLK